MLQISEEALRHGCGRAQDLFHLNALRAHDEAAVTFDAVFEALGVEASMRERLHDALLELVPVKGDPMVEATVTVSMLAGVLVGLLIADSATGDDEPGFQVAPGWPLAP